MTPVHSFLKSKATTRSQETPHRNISSHTVPLTVTHPLIPSQEGKPTTPQTNHYQQKPSTQNLPSREGSGVCDVCTQPPKIKSNHPMPRNTTSQYLFPNRAPLRNTPLNPLSRGEADTPQTNHYQQEPSPQSPLSRGEDPHHKPLNIKK